MKKRKKFAKVPLVVTIIIISFISVVVLSQTISFPQRVGSTRKDKIAGYFSPAFSKDGKEIFYIERKTEGYKKLLSPDEDKGNFMEVRTKKDDFSLKKLNIENNKTETIKTFPPSPLVNNIKKEHAGSIFQIPQTSILIDDQGRLQYAINFGDTCLSSVANNLENEIVEKNEWYKAEGACPTLPNDSSFHNEFEVVTLKGREMYPGGVAILNHEKEEADILLKNKNLQINFPKNVSYRDLEQYSVKKFITKDKEEARRLSDEYEEKGTFEEEGLDRPKTEEDYKKIPLPADAYKEKPISDNENYVPPTEPQEIPIPKDAYKEKPLE